MYIRQVKGGYRCEVVRKGERYSDTFPTKFAAQRWGIATEAEILARASGVVNSTLRDALEKFESELDPAGKGFKWDALRLRKFHSDLAPWLGLRLPDLRAEHLQQWVDARLESVSGATVRREANLLRSVLTRARRRWAWIEVNPFDGVAVPADSKARTRRVTPSEVRRVCRALGYRAGPPSTLSQEVALVFLIALRTAMRSGELLRLTGELVDLRRRVARAMDTKNGEDRDVPLSRAAVRLLGYVWKEGRLFRVTDATRDALFRCAVKKAGIVNLHFHDSRAEATTRMSKKVDALTLARITGHRDLKVLLRTYYRESAEDIAGRL